MLMGRAGLQGAAYAYAWFESLLVRSGQHELLRERQSGCRIRVGENATAHGCRYPITEGDFSACGFAAVFLYFATFVPFRIRACHADDLASAGVTTRRFRF